MKKIIFLTVFSFICNQNSAQVTFFTNYTSPDVQYMTSPIITNSPDGNFIVVVSDPWDHYIVIFKINKQGNVFWSKKLNINSMGTATQVKIMSDSTFVCNVPELSLLVKMDLNGNIKVLCQ